MSPAKPYRRGYPVALLVGLGEGQAVLWKVYSNVVKPEKTIVLNGARNDAKALYNFYEATVNAMRATIREGIRSIIVASPPRTVFREELLKHVRSHHSWLTQGADKATFAEIVGAALTVHDVTVLARASEFHRLLSETTTQETENLLELLEKSLNVSSAEPTVLYSLEEIEDKVFGTWLPGKPKPEYLMLADTYLTNSHQKNRIHRLQQVASNRKVKSRIVKADTPAGKRLLQLGGIVCILKTE